MTVKATEKSTNGYPSYAVSIEHHGDIESAINQVLHLTLNGMTAHEILELALDLILGMDWLAFEGRGSAFLVDPANPEVLVMTAVRGVPAGALDGCREIPFGTCLCGLAAKSQSIEYASCVDERHTLPTGEADHGHYCVPVVLYGKTLAVINVYVRCGHERNPVEERFLKTVADAVAGVLGRDRTRLQLEESERQLGAIVGAFDGLLYMVTPDFRIEFMNERFSVLIGHDATGEICYEAIHKRNDPCPWCTNERVLRGETVRWEVQLPLDHRYYMVVNRPIVHADGRISKLSLSTDITERRHAEVELEHAVEQTTSVLDGVVSALSSTTSQRDPYTAIHQERVARIACAIAVEMGLSADVVDGLRIASLLHDIGKIAVPSEILSKPGALTELEMGIVRSHSSIGFTLLEHVPFQRPVARAVLQHHERLDGSGYPDGLHAEEILLEAKIMAVADVVEAMASHRPYRPALGIQAATREIVGEAGRLFDADVVKACVAVLESPNVVI